MGLLPGGENFTFVLLFVPPKLRIAAMHERTDLRVALIPESTISKSIFGEP